MAHKYYFSTKDLVTIAVLSALGGALSTYIGYLGNLVNHIMGVPFGAGQFMAGLHVLWIILTVGITKKKGAATLTGTVKGAVELFLGSTHGIVVVIVSLCQGAMIDAVLFRDKTKEERKVIPYSIAAAISSASNVLIFQGFYFSGVPWIFILALCALAGVSGIIFGGWLSIQMMEALEQASILQKARAKHPINGACPIASGKKSKTMANISIIVSIVFVAAFTIGAVYFFFFVYAPLNPNGVTITGSVDHSYVFIYDDLKSKETTINAELNGSVTHVPAKDYTGIPLKDILTASTPKQNATNITVKAKDGYSATFSLSVILADSQIIIALEDSEYRLIAAKYEGAYWVKQIYAIEVS